MILENKVWYDVIPKNFCKPIDAEIGKWLYWGEKSILHSWLPRLDELIEAGKLRSAKITRKDSRWDPFPHKQCVLCAFTTNDEQEKADVKQLLATEFGIDVKTWKSDMQTNRDWSEDGWLQIEAKITAFKRKLAAGDIPDTPETRKLIRTLSKQFHDCLRESESVTQPIELKLSKSQDFLMDLKQEFASEDITLSTILNHLDRIQTQIARIVETKDIQGVSTSSLVRKNYIFVIMPFGKHHVDTYDTIRRAILKVSPEMVVERVDEKPGAFQITQEIWHSIKSACAIICDLTDERPNVYYELGYAHALDKPMIYIAREGTSIHFDVSGFKTVFFCTYHELEECLKCEIAGLLAMNVKTEPLH